MTKLLYNWGGLQGLQCAQASVAEELMVTTAHECAYSIHIGPSGNVVIAERNSILSEAETKLLSDLVAKTVWPVHVTHS